MNTTTLIKGAAKLVVEYCTYSVFLDGIRYRERKKIQAEIEALKIKNARLETKVEMQETIIDMLEHEVQRWDETNEEL